MYAQNIRKSLHKNKIIKVLSIHTHSLCSYHCPSLSNQPVHLYFQSTMNSFSPIEDSLSITVSDRQNVFSFIIVKHVECYLRLTGQMCIPFHYTTCPHILRMESSKICILKCQDTGNVQNINKRNLKYLQMSYRLSSSLQTVRTSTGLESCTLVSKIERYL